MKREWMKTLFVTGMVLALFISAMLVFAAEDSTNAADELEAGQAVLVRMPLPEKQLDDMDFQMMGSYQVSVNSEIKTFKGNPYIHHSTTYIPVRDLTEAFGISVYYEQKDRSITLSSKDKYIVLARYCLGETGAVSIDDEKGYPEILEVMTPYGDGEISIDLYVLNEDIAYVPLRFVCESFNLNVNYDHTVKEISVEGTRPAVQQNKQWFSMEQQLLIEAVRNMEGAGQIAFSGTAYDEEVEKVFEGTITRTFGGEDFILEEVVDTTSQNGDHYIGERGITKQGSLYRGGSFEVNRGNMGYHVSNRMAMTLLDGITKYSQLNIMTISDSDTETVYEVYCTSPYGYDSETVQYTIDKNTKTVVGYKELHDYGKNLRFTY